MQFKENLKKKGRLIFLLAAARVWSEVLVVIGFIVILYLIIKQYT